MSSPDLYHRVHAGCPNTCFSMLLQQDQVGNRLIACPSWVTSAHVRTSRLNNPASAGQPVQPSIRPFSDGLKVTCMLQRCRSTSLGRSAATSLLRQGGSQAFDAAPYIEAVVIGAGVIGLATARELVKRGVEVLCLERAGAFGTETSSRSSEVIHSGTAKTRSRASLLLLWTHTGAKFETNEPSLLSRTVYQHRVLVRFFDAFGPVIISGKCRNLLCSQ